MTTPERSGGSSGTVAGIVTAIGGIAMIVGPFLTFLTADTPQGSQSFSGIAPEIDGDGWFFLGVGVGLVIFGVALATIRSVPLSRVLGVLGLLAAGFMTYVGIVDIRDIASLEDQIPPEVAGQFSFSVGIGLYVALAGAIVGLIGSGMALFAKGEAPHTAPPPPPPPPPASTPPPPPAG